MLMQTTQETSPAFPAIKSDRSVKESCRPGPRRQHRWAPGIALTCGTSCPYLSASSVPHHLSRPTIPAASVALEIELCQAANVADSSNMHAVVPYELRDGDCTPCRTFNPCQSLPNSAVAILVVTQKINSTGDTPADLGSENANTNGVRKTDASSSMNSRACDINGCVRAPDVVATNAPRIDKSMQVG